VAAPENGRQKYTWAVVELQAKAGSSTSLASLRCGRNDKVLRIASLRLARNDKVLRTVTLRLARDDKAMC
jgi:hypothetical protein